jgi:hypothetical protein
MKRLLIATAALMAMAGAASAQPAYDQSQGQPPADYPKCTMPGQDRCVTGGRMRGKAARHHKAAKSDKGAKGDKDAKSSSDGERG